MQYTISINQRSVIENGWNLSFDDMVIFDFMSHFILEGALSKHIIQKKDYFWISFSKIREELPMLSGNSDSSIRRHISNLVRVGLIEKCDDEISIKNRISLYRLGKSFSKYWRSVNPSKNEDTPPNLEGYPSKNEMVTPPNLEGNNNTSILDYQYQNISPNGGLSASALDLEEEKKEKLRAELTGTQQSIEWGSQIRSYVFHPYNLVKDHRTGVETSNIQSVMDGNIDMFIEGYLQFLKNRRTGHKEEI